MLNTQVNSVAGRPAVVASNALTTARMKQFDDWLAELGVKSRGSLVSAKLAQLSSRCESNGQRRALHCHLQLQLGVRLDISDDGGRLTLVGEGARDPFVASAPAPEMSAR